MKQFVYKHGLKSNNTNIKMFRKNKNDLNVKPLNIFLHKHYRKILTLNIFCQNKNDLNI